MSKFFLILALSTSFYGFAEEVNKAEVKASQYDGFIRKILGFGYLEKFAEDIQKDQKKIEQHQDQDLKECNVSAGFADIVEDVLPSVVNVSTTQVMDKEEGESSQNIPGLPGGPFEDMFKKFLEQNIRPRKVQSLGSGFVIKVDDKSFYVVTNFHVVQDSKKIKIYLNDKTEVEGSIHASDERTDLAVVKVDLSFLPKEKRNIKALEWAVDEEARVGDWSIAIGNPFGFGSSVTVGVISSKGRDIVGRALGGKSDYIDDYIQHSAQINFGNSGGCLLNTKGKVIGINTAIISPSGGNVGIGFAIPAAIAKRTIDQLIDHKRTRRGWIGLKIQPFNEEMAESIGLDSGIKHAVIVAEVTKGGPSEKGGLEKDDVILEFNGKRLDDGSRLTRLVGESKIGETVPVKVWRKGKEVTLNVLIGEYEEAEEKGLLDNKPAESKLAEKNNKSQEILGITLAERPEASKKDAAVKGGIVVLKADPNSAAAEIGLQKDDILLEANHKELKTPKDFNDVVEQAKQDKRKHVLILVMRNNEPRYAPLRIEPEEEDSKKDADEPSKKKQKTENLENDPKKAKK